MSEIDYWKGRCRRAEQLLAKARAGLASTKVRDAVLATLGELRTDEWMRSDVLRRRTGASNAQLRAMAQVGLITSKADGWLRLWQLEHLVVPQEGAE